MFSNTLLLVCLMAHFASEFSYGQKENLFFRKDYQYIEETKSFYKINSIPKTFSEAKRTCALEGASLFYPENHEEANAVISFVNSIHSQPIWWITVGISDLIVKGVFETIDGKRITEVYHEWNVGEPNDIDGKEDCVNLNSNGFFNDISCDRKHSFICKKTLQSLEWNQHCNIPDLGYTFVEATCSCYKLHTTPLNWTEAYKVCNAEQSYLAVINDRLEAKSLVQLMETAPKYNRVTGSYLRGLYHIGFHNRFNEGWQTVKGTLINDNGAWWDNYQPDGGNYDQCGTMFYTGLLNQIDCDMKCFFICEHEVDQSLVSQRSEELSKSE